MGPPGRPFLFLFLFPFLLLMPRMMGEGGEGGAGAGGALGEALHRSRRGVLQLAGAILCATGQTPLAYLRYGCYCGLGGSGWPRDKVDWRKEMMTLIATCGAQMGGRYPSLATYFAHGSESPLPGSPFAPLWATSLPPGPAGRPGHLLPVLTRPGVGQDTDKTDEDKCQEMTCKCDQEAAQCLAEAPYNSKYVFWPETLCGTHNPECEDD
ncbi:hypothetical protein JD844_020127 [Phrynosoma platyrhinos]|uniref:Phospholipase A2-like central domain-containing protein n=1 Tax=Phrynosoma platyrhinos TaxID=52577 RepID=A0ABQ7TRS6_PHRPL|nr:hypothetical protein JD844_020127 [Phrynosoma platyrhinos]